MLKVFPIFSSLVNVISKLFRKLYTIIQCCRTRQLGWKFFLYTNKVGMYRQDMDTLIYYYHMQGGTDMTMDYDYDYLGWGTKVDPDEIKKKADYSELERWTF